MKLTDDLRFQWLVVDGAICTNDLNTTGYMIPESKRNSLQYTFNETVALRVNYLERGFNMDDSRNNGEFSTQEIRAYLLTLSNHS